MNDSIYLYELPPPWANSLEALSIQENPINKNFNYWPEWNMPVLFKRLHSDNFTPKERYAANSDPSFYRNFQRNGRTK